MNLRVNASLSATRPEKAACKVLLNNSMLDVCSGVSKNVNYIELAENKYFSEFFVMSMFFESE